MDSGGSDGEIGVQGTTGDKKRNMVAGKKRPASLLTPFGGESGEDNPQEVQLTDMGTRLKLQGNLNEALSKYTEAYKVNPDYAPAYYNIGVIYSELGHYEEALRFYVLAIEKNPCYIEAYCNIGVIYKHSNKADLAIQYYRRALSFDPNFLIAKNNLAIALTDYGTLVKREGDVKLGIRYYKDALVYNVQYADAYYNLGVAYGELGRFDRAITYYELAILTNPMCCEAYNNLGVLMKDQDNLPRAIECYQRAIDINPKFAQALNNLAVVFTIQGKLAEAFGHLKSALQVDPSYAEAYNNIGVLYRDEGRIERAIMCYDQSIKINARCSDAEQNRLLAMNYVSVRPLQDVFEAHKAWGKKCYDDFEGRRYSSWNVAPYSRNEPRPIRVGYLSPDFFSHSVSYFVEALLRYHDRSRFEVYCFANVTKEDNKTELLRGLVKPENWKNVRGLKPEQVAQIAHDSVDVLVDLTGHTAGNLLGVMALRPAPVQVTMIGYPNTTGLPTVQYRITDAVVDPPGTEQLYVEELVRLSPCFLCYTPTPEHIPVALAPCLSNHYVTFGSFNNLAKVTDSVIQLWASVLHKVPDSRIVLKCKPFVNQKTCDRVIKRFGRCGVDPARVSLLGLMPLNSDHLRAYNMIDISLDTFPYAGTTTTCESLHMGVPVVTLDGPTHAQRVGKSLLHAVGYPEWVALNEAEFVDIAEKLASDIPTLSQIRQAIRPKMQGSSLMDGPNYVHQLESAYESMLERQLKTT